jgi:hypothetical protein
MLRVGKPAVFGHFVQHARLRSVQVTLVHIELLFAGTGVKSVSLPFPHADTHRERSSHTDADFYQNATIRPEMSVHGSNPVSSRSPDPSATS